MSQRMTIQELRDSLKKKPKYRNEKTVVNGITFDSKKEANRYKDLKLMEKAGKIRAIRIQFPCRLVANGIYICDYIADFVYRDQETGKDVVEDAKGVRTKEYRLKAKLFEACYGFKILET